MIIGAPDHAHDLRPRQRSPPRLQEHGEYRKFSGEYRVWQGSDFDLDAAVEEELSKIGRFELAEQLNSRHALLPIVARKYTIKTGGLRYFAPRSWARDLAFFGLTPIPPKYSWEMWALSR